MRNDDHRGVRPDRAAFELRPLHDALMVDLKRSTKLFMDETRAPILDRKHPPKAVDGPSADAYNQKRVLSGASWFT
jgi:hypothetical protein